MTKPSRFALALWTLASVAVAVGCGGTNYANLGIPTATSAPSPSASPSPGATPTFPTACPTTAAMITQAFPSAGATGVNASLTSVLFIVNTGEVPLAHWETLALNGVTQGAVSTPQTLPSPIPTLGPNQAYLSGPITTPLAARTAYQTHLTYIDGCGLQDGQFVGTFTTQ